MTKMFNKKKSLVKLDSFFQSNKEEKVLLPKQKAIAPIKKYYVFNYLSELEKKIHYVF